MEERDKRKFDIIFYAGSVTMGVLAESVHLSVETQYSPDFSSIIFTCRYVDLPASKTYKITLSRMRNTIFQATGDVLKQMIDSDIRDLLEVRCPGGK